ncbi:phosphatase 2C-like domain-containing protein [Aspergillus carlsbadensis]|nr:phosphatase 2C-like domain-containing protein [Aspergillus carlsbadensis]
MNGTAKHPVELCEVGGASAQGSRPSQQDRYIALTPDKLPSHIGKDMALFAIFDGHGSEHVAEHALKHIPPSLLDSPAFQEADYERAMQSAIDQEDKVLFEEFRRGENRFATVGSTVTIALLDLGKGELVVGNLGDSHAILAEVEGGRKEVGSVTRLTESHKPESPHEKQRIEDAGGMVHAQKNVPRIGALNMSRAIGDLEYKKPLNNMESGPITEEQQVAVYGQDKPAEERDSFLSTEMSFKRMELKRDKQYVLALTTDGVTNYTEDRIIMGNVSQQLKVGSKAQEAAKKIVDEAASRPGSDNATCILILLNGSQLQ